MRITPAGCAIASCRASGKRTMETMNFYDKLVPFYHLLHMDWNESIRRHAFQLDHIIKTYWGEPVHSILDVSCGIGTQALGLSWLGYQVTGSDLSAGAIERARQEAQTRGLNIDFSVADMRAAFDHHRRKFDLVIACDNAIPHLLSDEEILKAFQQFYLCVRPGGGVLISVRDYDQEIREGIQVKPYSVRVEGGKRYFIFQAWDFKGDVYEISMYIVEDEREGACVTHVMRSQYYAIGTNQLADLMRAAGFDEVQRLDGLFFQPVMIGKKGDG